MRAVGGGNLTRKDDFQIGNIEAFPTQWEEIPLKSYFKEVDVRVGDEPHELLALTRKGIVPRSEMKQRASVSDDYTKYKKCRRGMLVMNKMQAWNGAFALSGYEGMVSPDYTVFEPKPEICVRFFEYLFKTDLLKTIFKGYSRGMGTGFLRLHTGDFGAIKICAPPLYERETIASFLDCKTALIDDLIAKRERQIKLLQEHRTALISRAVTKGLNPNVPMKDSGIEWLGKIPENWDVKRLRYVGDAIIGLTYDPADVVGECEGVLVLRASNVDGQRIVLEDNVFVKREIPERLVTRVGDILICSRSGSRSLIGKNAKINEESAGLTFGTFMMVFRSSFNDFLFYVFNSMLFNFQSAAFMTTTINQLTVGNIYSFDVPMPPPDEQRLIAVFLDRETTKIDTFVTKVQQSVEKLREYRLSLISAAVTGKLDVRNWQPSSEPAEETLHA